MFVYATHFHHMPTCACPSATCPPFPTPPPHYCSPTHATHLPTHSATTPHLPSHFNYLPCTCYRATAYTRAPTHYTAHTRTRRTPAGGHATWCRGRRILYFCLSFSVLARTVNAAAIQRITADHWLSYHKTTIRRFSRSAKFCRVLLIGGPYSVQRWILSSATLS